MYISIPALDILKHWKKPPSTRKKRRRGKLVRPLLCAVKPRLQGLQLGLGNCDLVLRRFFRCLLFGLGRLRHRLIGGGRSSIMLRVRRLEPHHDQPEGARIDELPHLADVVRLTQRRGLRVAIEHVLNALRTRLPLDLAGLGVTPLAELEPEPVAVGDLLLGILAVGPVPLPGPGLPRLGRQNHVGDVVRPLERAGVVGGVPLSRDRAVGVNVHRGDLVTALVGPLRLHRGQDSVVVLGQPAVGLGPEHPLGGVLGGVAADQTDLVAPLRLLFAHRRVADRAGGEEVAEPVVSRLLALLLLPQANLGLRAELGRLGRQLLVEGQRGHVVALLEGLGRLDREALHLPVLAVGEQVLAVELRDRLPLLAHESQGGLGLGALGLVGLEVFQGLVDPRPGGREQSQGLNRLRLAAVVPVLREEALGLLDLVGQRFLGAPVALAGFLVGEAVALELVEVNLTKQVGNRSGFGKSRSHIAVAVDSLVLLGIELGLGFNGLGLALFGLGL